MKQYKGTIEIEGVQSMTNPVLKIEDAYLGVIFVDENGFKQSRLMLINLSSVDLISAINSNEHLKNFK